MGLHNEITSLMPFILAQLLNLAFSFNLMLSKDKICIHGPQIRNFRGGGGGVGQV